MSSDVTGAVRLDPAVSGQQPRLAVAVLVSMMTTAMVVAGAVIAFAPLLSGRSAAELRLSGRGSTQGAEPLRGGDTGQAYLVVHNDSGVPVRIVAVRPGTVRLRPGSAAPRCRPDWLRVRVGRVGLDVGINQSALLTADVTLDHSAADSCRGAIFDLPVTALARPA